MRAVTAALAMVLAVGPLAFAPQPARATIYGNPVPRFEGGDFAVGLGVSEDRLTGFADLGVTDPGTLRFLAGVLEVAGDEDIAEFGVLYRHKVAAELFRLGSLPVAGGAVGGARLGSGDIVEVDVDLMQFDVGFGAKITPTPPLDLYALLVFQHVELETAEPIEKVNLKGKLVTVTERDDDDFALVGGAELWASESVALGAELHFGLDDDDFGLWAELKF